MYTEVRINGESVDLTEEIKIPISLINPHLTYETIPDSTANIPNIPFSIRNQRIFEYAEMPQAGNDLRSYDCELLYNGALVYRGTAYVKSANPLTGYQLEVGDDLSHFFGEFQNTLLTELDLGTVPFSLDAPVKVMVGGQDAVCYPTILNPDYYSTNGSAVAYNGVVNDYTAEGIISTIYNVESPIVPALFVNFLLQRIAAATGVTIDGNYLNHPTWRKLILTNWRALDGRDVVTLNQHVPDWTIPTLLLELRKIPNLEFTFNNSAKRLSIDFWEEKLKAPPVADWTNKATVGHEKYPEFNRRLHLAFELDGGDSLMKDKPEALADYITPGDAVLGNVAVGLCKISMKLSTFLVDEVTGLPIAKQTGVTEQFNQLNVNTAPRLLFWHGLIAGVPTSLPELDNISLCITGENGVGETSWTEIEAIRLGMFYLKKSFTLTEVDLALLDFSRMIHYNGLNYLVAHVAGELPIVKEFACLLVKV